MEEQEFHSIKKSDKNYRVKRPTQTGFSSPATHYSEPRIDLNDTLVSNASATFYIRVSDNSFKDFDIFEKDVLIIDKSITPKMNQLVIAIFDDVFDIVKIGKLNNQELKIWGVITYIIKSVL